MADMASTLRRGSSGAEVKALQQKLGITADGVFGPATEAAVRKYQQEHGLTADGVVGAKTWAALGTAAPATPAAPAAPAAPKPGTGNQKVEGYGFVEAFLKAYPELQKIVSEAVAGQWTDDRFQTAIRGTNWYRTRSESQRQWDIEEKQDPAAAAKAKADAEAKIRALAGKSGITVTDAQIKSIAQSVYRNGADDLAVQAAMANLMPTGTAAPPTQGTTGASVTDLRDMAYEYGVPVSNQRLNAWSRQIMAGTQTVDGLKGYFQQAATSLFPQFQQQLQAGMTTRDLLDPYIQMARSTLELDEQQVNLTDPKWIPTQSTPNGIQVMTLQEWQKKLRTDPAYGFGHTAGARDQAYSIVSRLGRLFGGYA